MLKTATKNSKCKCWRKAKRCKKILKNVNNVKGFLNKLEYPPKKREKQKVATILKTEYQKEC